MTSSLDRQTDHPRDDTGAKARTGNWQGWLRRISALPLKMFEEICARQKSTLYSHMSLCLNDTSLAELAPLLAAKGIGIINASPLSMGLLTESGPLEWHPASSQLITACAQAARHCRSRGGNISEVALRFSLAQNIFASTLVGILNAEEINTNVQQIAQPLNQQLLREIMEILQPVHNQTWFSGRPENNDGIRITD